ncbi:MAG: hypothetical protein U5K69_29065 [Balneolaceae bacterium]|nr:hypothetical protein [Balneolaceae bacterium]
MNGDTAKKLSREIRDEIESIKKRIDDFSSKQLIKKWQENPFSQRPDMP